MVHGSDVETGNKSQMAIYMAIYMVMMTIITIAIAHRRTTNFKNSFF